MSSHARDNIIKRLMTFINKKLFVFHNTFVDKVESIPYWLQALQTVAMWKRCPYTGMWIQRCLCADMRSTLLRGLFLHG